MRLANRCLLITAIIAALAIQPAVTALAQESTPAATADASDQGPYVSYLIGGSCAAPEPGNVIELADLAFPADTVEADDVDTPISPVAHIATRVNEPLDQLMARNYALVVRAPENPNVDAVCGDIRGAANERGHLFASLDEIDNSGYSGIAWLNAEEGWIRVTVLLSRHALPAPSPSTRPTR